MLLKELLPCSEFSYQAFPLFSCQILPILSQGRLQCSLNLLKILVLDEEVILGEMYVIQRGTGRNGGFKEPSASWNLPSYPGAEHSCHITVVEYNVSVP